MLKGVAFLSGGGGGSGTVTSIDVSGGATGLTATGGPVTTVGTITLDGVLVLAHGGSGVSSLGAGLVSTNGTIYGPTTLNTGLSWSGGTLSNTGVVVFGGATGTITLGAGLAMAGNVLSNTGSLGTVTSIIAGTGLSGGTITTTGTISLAAATTSTLGGVVTGNGIQNTSGTISIAASVAGLSAALDATIPAGTYDLGPFIQGGTVLNSYAHVVSGGTITLTGAIGAPGTYTAITGLSSLAVSTTADSVGTATAANVIAAGSHLWLIVVNTSTPLGGSVFFSVKVP